VLDGYRIEGTVPTTAFLDVHLVCKLTGVAAMRGRSRHPAGVIKVAPEHIERKAIPSNKASS
jgi:hypothetical protein